MPTVNQTRDVEIQRQTKNQTEAQKRKTSATKEGVVVNSFYKDPKILNMNELYDSLVISDDAKMPKKLYENKTTADKSLTPISLISIGVMGATALLSLVAKKSAQSNLKLKPAQKLPSLTRNLAINEETHQAIYQMVQCPNQKTILAGAGVLTISAMGFMGKMFIDGFKEIWVKKREADIQKNLQEKLVAVETQSFSGKIQITRGMLADKAREFSDYLCSDCVKTPVTFKKLMSGERTYFTSRSQTEEKDNSLKYFALGALTFGSIVGLGFLAMKNLRGGKKFIEQYTLDVKNKISEIAANSNANTKETDKINLKNMLQAIDAEPELIKKELSKLNWDEADKANFLEETLFSVKKSTAQADKALGGDGTPKPAFYSHVNDYRAFLYNWLLDTSNPLFKNLFFGITGVTALSYGGKAVGEAIKEVQVKKMNAETELDLQKRLVATELRNFKAKKDAAIDPLCEEFYNQLERGKPKEELKVIAENILFEVKNGPPFVYS